MLDVNKFDTDRDEIVALLHARDPNAGYGQMVDQILESSRERKKMICEVEQYRRRRKSIAKEIHAGDASLLGEAKQVKDNILGLETRLKTLEEEILSLNLKLPNLPDKSIPLTPHKEDKQVVSIYKGTRQSEVVSDHLVLGERLGILDFESSNRSTGAQFPCLKGAGARLEWSLLNFCIDRAIGEGYKFHLPPILVTDSSMVTAGVFPKFEEQVYRIEAEKLNLVPTAEVVMAGMMQGMVFEEDDLPIRYCAYTPCFRREAGASGRRDRGLLRVHQFNKLELFVCCAPDQTADELDRLRAHATTLVTDLGIPHQVTLLPAGDLGNQCAKTYDIEVFLPSFGEFVEVSSCSSCTDYQARRGNIKFRPKVGKSKYVHTLNGSALAMPRLLISILENYADSDNVIIPPVLVPYFGSKKLLS